MNKTITVSLRMSALALALSQAYGPAAHAQATAPSAEPTTVVVTGIRASARSAVAIKKDSMEVMDVITAEDIGKLPDTNVAETLTRIPGVQGYRYGGEGASPVGQGSGLTIRGLAGLTAAQVNGRSFATAGSRDYNIEGANPAMIAAVEVFKNPSAEHIEGGIGGLINVKTRNPSDFKGPTGGFAINGKWNDVAKKTDPEYFGMLANRWDLGGGQRFGVMVAGTYAKSTNRSDNNPANGGANYKRIVRADSAEYATLAAANTANDIRQPLSKYVGRTDVSHLAGVPTLATSSTVGANVPNTAGLTQAQIDNIISAPTVTNNVFQETIMRERKGLNLAADYRVSNTLRFYAEANWVYYLYHQHYRGLNAGNLSSNVQNLQTTPFALTEGLANRNLNGGSDDVLNNKRFLSGTFLDETVNTMGGIEKHPYETGIGAVGADWNVTPDLWLKADFSYTKSQQKVNNRNVVMDSAPGLTWGVNRVIDGAPHQLTFTGPDLANPNNFVFRSFDNGNNAVTDDSGYALALDGAWSGDMPFLNKLKFGTRYAHAESDFSPFGFGGRQLTKDGLARNTANQIFVGSTSVWENAPTNFMRGDAGYSGGYIVYQPEMLLGDQVRTLFPNAGIPAQPYVEQPNNHRWVGENTLAFYLSGDFTALDDRLRGNVGVRAVRTEGEARARILDRTKATETYVDNLQSTSYTHYLPSLNMTYDLAKDFMVRAGFGKSLTRAALGDLNPSVNPNLSDGSGGMGNPNLRPTTATSFDLSVERYFTSTNYIAAGVFYKDISGLVNDVL